jgi:hypothetical protein
MAQYFSINQSNCFLASRAIFWWCSCHISNIQVPNQIQYLEQFLSEKIGEIFNSVANK